MFDVLSERGLVVLITGLITGLLAFAVKIAVKILGPYVVRHIRDHNAKRDELVKAIATELGVGFAEIREKRLLAKLKGMALFNSFESDSRSRLNQWPHSEEKIKHAATAEIDIGARLYIFDYGNKFQNSTQHTVAAVESDALMLPAFFLSPKPVGFLKKTVAVLTTGEIQFDQHEGFSKSFVLKGADEEAIRRIFDREMLDLFAERKGQGLHVEATRGLFIVYLGADPTQDRHRFVISRRSNFRKQPGEIHEFMKEVLAIYSAFTERCSGKSFAATSNGPAKSADA